jgi:hypothetical protein
VDLYDRCAVPATQAAYWNEGKIHLVLRNPDDQDEVQVTSLSTGQMLGRAAAPTPAPRRTVAPRPTQVSTSTPAPVPPKPVERPPVRVIKSGTVTETKAVRDSSAN